MHQLGTYALFRCALLLGVFDWISLSYSKETNPTLYKTREGCLCPFIYLPVCGTDGVTYGNGCELECAQRHGKYVLGVCKGECPCCKPAYDNGAYPVDIPVPTQNEDTSTTSGGQSGNEGWGWGWGGWNMGLSYDGWRSSGLTYPYFWKRGPSATYPPSKANIVYVIASKPEKKEDDDKEELEELSKSSTANVAPTAPRPEVAKSLPLIAPSSTMVPELPKESVKKIRRIDDTDSESDD